jgi:peptidoglycan L-alanyl-D-glutamate endopeptidase CwlK
MINSRKIEDLIPIVQKKVIAFKELCEADGIDLLITATYRDHESQNALYAQGRTTNGPIVTNARGGQSMHNFKCAVDVVPLRNGKPVWTTGDPIWARVGALGEAAGLEWSGRWTGRLREYAHFQYTGGLSLTDLQNGKVIA